MTKRPKLQYLINGKVIKAKTANCIAGIAYIYCKGIDGQAHISADRLVELLRSQGVTDPRHTPFETTLPNGKVLAGVIPTEAPRVEDLAVTE